jgi:penicillin-binding protein 1A
MGLDRPEKIKDNAQGGVLAAPAWTAFMTEVYRRKPQPPDWPKPMSIVTREIDISSGLLQTPYCPRGLVSSEFYISGTEPTRDCDKHLAYGTPGLGPIDTTPMILPGTPIPGTSPRPQAPTSVSPPTIQPGYEPPTRAQPRRPTVFDTTRGRPIPRDTVSRPRDTVPTTPPPSDR